MTKLFFRKSVARILARQVRRLYKKNSFKTVVVVGSVGKSSTKRAIAEYLGSQYRVQYQQGNYNDLITVPLVYFGLPLTSLFNPFSWLKKFYKIERQLRRPYEYDVVVLELGTDGPRQINEFAEFIRADIAVVTAITAEHMEFFNSLDQVATEELSVTNFADRLLINIDDVPEQYLEDREYMSYGTSKQADARTIQKQRNTVSLSYQNKSIELNTRLAGLHSQKVLAAAFMTAEALNMPVDNPAEALSRISAMPGRMQLLQGKEHITIIDDTYNASPEAVIAALDTLYAMDTQNKIAVLGNMNEMGGFSKAAHEQVARHCKSEKLDKVIVLGKEAELFLAPLAKAHGNDVKVFHSPYDIGEYLAEHASASSAILFKGSQNGVFLEEAIKPLLADSADKSKLVRQSKSWLKKKQHQFAKAKYS